MKLGDFTLEPDLKSAAKIASYFFGSDAQYMMGNPGPRPQVDVSEYEIEAYADIISNRGSNAMDSRSATVEVQTEEPMDICDVVEAVVLPNNFADSKLGAELKALNIALLPYNSVNKYAPNEFGSEIHSICTRYYLDRGFYKIDHS